MYTGRSYPLNGLLPLTRAGTAAGSASAAVTRGEKGKTVVHHLKVEKKKMTRVDSVGVKAVGQLVWHTWNGVVEEMAVGRVSSSLLIKKASNDDYRECNIEKALLSA